MNFQQLLDSTRARATSVIGGVTDLVEAATDSFGSGLGYAKQTLIMSWLFGSNEVVDTEFDEKHYFLIPYKIAECGYTLYSMRCLPDGVPPVNDLPKRRIFHLPNPHAAKMVEQLLLDQAAANLHEETESSPTGSRLTDLADRIDELDRKAFNGALLIGGLVALANPVAGGILAAKAMIPSIGLLLAKYGLKQAGDSLNERNLQSQIKQAEKDVLAEFHGTEASQVVDSLLEQLDKAINTDVFEYDPIVQGVEGPSDELPDALTTKAMLNTYEQVLANRKMWVSAGLGPEDIRWLEMLGSIHSNQ